MSSSVSAVCPVKLNESPLKPSRFSAFSPKISRLLERGPMLVELSSSSLAARRVTDSSLPSQESPFEKDDHLNSASVTPISRVGNISLNQWNASRCAAITPIPRTASAPLESAFTQEGKFQSLNTPDLIEEAFERSGAQSPKPIGRG